MSVLAPPPNFPESTFYSRDPSGMSFMRACFGKKREDDAARRNEEIERLIRQDKKRADKEVKILLLGAGESGKSTVLKQMRLIYAKGFALDERYQWRAVIFSNLIQAFQVVLRAMEEQGISFANSENETYIDIIESDPEIDENHPMPLKCLPAFASLWDDKGVQAAIEKGNEYALHDNLTYFFAEIDRLFDKNYVPTNQDILRARLRTSGISETIFELESLTYRMFDVGGQRSERKKWIHAFDNVQVVLFLAAISAYDHVLIEDKNGNQMHEALLIFETIATSRWFQNTALILFLNKFDIFQEKIKAGNALISKYFPEYNGSSSDMNAAKEFFANQFRKRVPRTGKELYVHYTTATDTDLLKKTMTSVQDMITQNNIHRLMLQ